MLVKLFKSKIHRATITDADLHYEGSCSIDPLLMREANILEHESIWIWNINNGERLMTYAIPGKPNQIGLNGSAARLGHTGDLVIISTFADMEKDAASQFKPTVVLVNNQNQITSITKKSGTLTNKVESIKFDLSNKLPNGFIVNQIVIEGGYFATAKISCKELHLLYKFNIKTGNIINSGNNFINVEGLVFIQEDFDVLLSITRNEYEKTFLESEQELE